MDSPDRSRPSVEARLTTKHPGRADVIVTLLDFFFDPEQAVPASVHVQDASSGPDVVAELIDDVMRSCRTLRAIYVDPMTCPSPGHIFGRILASLGPDGSEGVSQSHTSPVRPAVAFRQTADSSFGTFIHHLQDLLHVKAEGQDRTRRVALIIDRAERMRDIWPEQLIGSLFNLAEEASIQGRLCVITISSLGISHFRISRGPGSHRAPDKAVIVSSTRMGKSDVIADLTNHFHELCSEASCPSNLDMQSLRSLYRTYISVAYDAFAAEVRTLAELRTLVCCVWHPFVQPVLDGSLSSEFVRPLLLRAAALFRDALDRLYTRQISPLEWIQSWVTNRSQPHTSEGSVRAIENRAATVQPFSLLTSVLILASVLASYNPARLDVRFFVRDESAISAINGQEEGKSRGARKKGGALRKLRQRKRPYEHSKNNGDAPLNRQELLGPRPFTLDRLFNIVQSLATEFAPGLGIESEVQSATRSSQVSRVAGGQHDRLGRPHDGWETKTKGVSVFGALNVLLKLGLLVRISAVDRLDVTTTLRTNVEREAAIRLGKDIGLDVEQWMYD